MEEISLSVLYSSGELALEDLKRLKEKFNLICSHCGSAETAIMVKNDDDGYCDTCSSPYAIATIKCKDCGQAVSIRN